MSSESRGLVSGAPPDHGVRCRGFPSGLLAAGARRLGTIGTARVPSGHESLSYGKPGAGTRRLAADSLAVNGRLSAGNDRRN